MATWTKKDRAAYISDLGVTDPPFGGAVQQFLEDVLFKSPLPDNWVATPDESSGRFYFANTATQESSWSHPLEQALRAIAVACASCLECPASEREDWIRSVHEAWTEDAQAACKQWKKTKTEDGKTYYFHKETKETMWEPPSSREYPPFELMLESLGSLYDPNYIQQLQRLATVTTDPAQARQPERGSQPASAPGTEQQSDDDNAGLSDLVQASRGSVLESSKRRKEKKEKKERDSQAESTFQGASEPAEQQSDEDDDGLSDLVKVQRGSVVESSKRRKEKKEKKETRKEKRSREHDATSASTGDIDSLSSSRLDTASERVDVEAKMGEAAATGSSFHPDRPAQQILAQSLSEWSQERLQLQKQLNELELQKDLGALTVKQEVEASEMALRRVEDAQSESVAKLRRHEQWEAEQRCLEVELCQALLVEEQVAFQVRHNAESTRSELDNKLKVAQMELAEEAEQRQSVQAECEAREKPLKKQLQSAIEAKDAEVKECRKQRRQWQFKHSEDGVVKLEREQRISELTASLETNDTELTQMTNEINEHIAFIALRDKYIEELQTTSELESAEMLEMNSELSQIRLDSGMQSLTSDRDAHNLVEELQSRIAFMQEEMQKHAHGKEELRSLINMLEAEDSIFNREELQATIVALESKAQEQRSQVESFSINEKLEHDIAELHAIVEENQAEFASMTDEMVQLKLHASFRPTSAREEVQCPEDPADGSSDASTDPQIAGARTVVRQRDAVASDSNGLQQANSATPKGNTADGRETVDMRAQARQDISTTVRQRESSPARRPVARRVDPRRNDDREHQGRQRMPQATLSTAGFVRKSQAVLRSDKLHLMPQKIQSRRPQSTPSLTSHNLHRVSGPPRRAVGDRSASALQVVGRERRRRPCSPRQTAPAGSDGWSDVLLSGEYATAQQDRDWTLPYGGLHSPDPDALAAAERKAAILRVKVDGQELHKLPPALRSDHAIVLAAVRSDGLALAYAATPLRGTREVVRAAVASHGLALACASEELQGDLEIVALAVRSHGLALHYASEALKGNPDIVRVAVESHGLALQYAPEQWRADREIVLAAVRSHSVAMIYATQELRHDPELLSLASHGAIKHLTTEPSGDTPKIRRPLSPLSVALDNRSRLHQRPRSAAEAPRRQQVCTLERQKRSSPGAWMRRNRGQITSQPSSPYLAPLGDTPGRVRRRSLLSPNGDEPWSTSPTLHSAPN